MFDFSQIKVARALDIDFKFIFDFYYLFAVVTVVAAAAAYTISSSDIAAATDQSIKLIFPNGLRTFPRFLFNQSRLSNSLRANFRFSCTIRKADALEYFQLPTICTLGTRFKCNIIQLFICEQQKGKVGKERRTFELLAYGDECVCVHKIGFTLQNVNNEI